MPSKHALPSPFFLSLSNLQYLKKKIIYLEAACKIFIAVRRFGCPTTCGILVLWPGIKFASTASEGILNYWATVNVPTVLFIFFLI